MAGGRRTGWIPLGADQAKGNRLQVYNGGVAREDSLLLLLMSCTKRKLIGGFVAKLGKGKSNCFY